MCTFVLTRLKPYPNFAIILQSMLSPYFTDDRHGLRVNVSLTFSLLMHTASARASSDDSVSVKHGPDCKTPIGVDAISATQTCVVSQSVAEPNLSATSGAPPLIRRPTVLDSISQMFDMSAGHLGTVSTDELYVATLARQSLSALAGLPSTLQQNFLDPIVRYQQSYSAVAGSGVSQDSFPTTPVLFLAPLEGLFMLQTLLPVGGENENLDAISVQVSFDLESVLDLVMLLM